MCRQELVTEDDCGFEGYTANSWVDLYKLADVPAVVTCLLTAEERLVSATAQFFFSTGFNLCAVHCVSR